MDVCIYRNKAGTWQFVFLGSRVVGRSTIRSGTGGRFGFVCRVGHSLPLISLYPFFRCSSVFQWAQVEPFIAFSTLIRLESPHIQNASLDKTLPLSLVEVGASTVWTDPVSGLTMTLHGPFTSNDSWSHPCPD